jgi:hypothetical protein
MAKRTKKVSTVETVEINALVDESIDKVDSITETVETTAVVEIVEESGAADATAESTEEAGTVDATVENTEETGAVDVSAEKKGRRAIGSGSVWLQGNGKYGYCVQLTSDKKLKALYKNKLRFLGSAATYELASIAAQKVIDNREEYLKAKLLKLGHKFDDGGSVESAEASGDEK